MHKVEISATKKKSIIPTVYIYIIFLYVFLIVWWLKEKRNVLHTVKKEG
jgi:hypothetical protein